MAPVALLLRGPRDVSDGSRGWRPPWLLVQAAAAHWLSVSVTGDLAVCPVDP